MIKKFFSYQILSQSLSGVSVYDAKIIKFLYDKGHFIYFPLDYNEYKRKLYNYLGFNYVNFDIKKLTFKDLEVIELQTKKSKKNIILLLFYFEKGLFYKILSEKEFSLLEMNKFSLQGAAALIDDSKFNAFINQSLKQYIQKRKFYVYDNNYFVKRIELVHQLWFLTYSEDEEILLSFLPLKPEKIENKKGLNYFYLLSSSEQMILSFDQRGLLQEYFVFANDKLLIDNGLIKVLTIGETFWKIPFFYNEIFNELIAVQGLKGSERLSEVVRINLLLNKKSDYDYLLFLLDRDILPTSILSELLIAYRKFGDDINLSEENIIHKFYKMLSNDKIQSLLLDWFSLWKPSKKESLFILLLIKRLIEPSRQCPILPLYQKVFKQFFSSKKSKEERIFFQILYSELLIECGYKNESKKILTKLIDSLPEVNFEDIFPIETVGALDDRVSLRVKILSLLLQIEDKEKNRDNIIESLVRLQPLNIRFVSKMASGHSVLSFKAKNIQRILEPGDLMANPAVFTEEFNPFTDRDKELLLWDKKIKKFYSDILKWVANVKMDNYFTDVSKYAKQLNKDEYPLTYEIISDISKSLGINNLSVYIVDGSSKNLFRAYGNAYHKFLLIGSSYLLRDSQRYLTAMELKFAVSVELFYLLFDFVRITSTDLWRGIIERGVVALESILYTLPFVGILGKKFYKLLPLGKLSESIGKLYRFLLRSGEVLQSTVKVLKTINKLSVNNIEREKYEILTISRMMQEIADKGALVYCGDLVSATRAIILTSELFSPSYLKDIRQKGLYSVLRNEIDRPEISNLAVRLSSLYRFYLSPEYEKLRRSIVRY